MIKKRKDNMSRKKRVLVLYAADVPEYVQNNQVFIEKLNQGFHDDDVVVEGHNFHDIQLSFVTGHIEARIFSSQEPLNVFDFVFFKAYFRFQEVAVSIATYLQQEHIKFVSTELLSYISQTKLSEYARLARANLPIVKTLYLDIEHYVPSYDTVVSTLGTPFIFKAIDASRGDDNHLIHSSAQLKEAIRTHTSPTASFVAQEYIENDGDLRIVVLGRKITMVIERRKTEGTHLNNTSRGASARLLSPSSLPAKYARIARKAAALVHPGKAGVDMMIDKNSGEPVILEVNASPQAATGTYLDEKVSMYCKYINNMLK